MALFSPCTVNSPFDGTLYNANMVRAENSFADLGPYVISGLAVTIGTGLSVNVASGTASIGGRVTTTSTTITGLTDNTTNHLYILTTGAGTSNTTGTAPANSAKLGTCVTAAGVVTSVNMLRSSGRQLFVRPDALVPGAVGAPASINLASWALAAADNVPVFGVLPGGAVPSPTGPLSLVLTDSATAIESTMITLTHHSSGTPAAGYGTALEFGGDDNANVNRKMSRIAATWLDPSTALSISQVTLKAAKGAAFVPVLTCDGNQLTTCLGALLVNGATGATVSLLDAGTTTEPTLLTIQHRSSGTPGASFGTTVLLRADNASNALADQLSVATGWSAATAGAESSLAIFSVRRSGANVECLRLNANGNGRAQFANDLFHVNASAQIGVFNIGPASRQVGASAAGIAAITDAAARTAITALQNALASYGWVTAPA